MKKLFFLKVKKKSGWNTDTPHISSGRYDMNTPDHIFFLKILYIIS